MTTVLKKVSTLTEKGQTTIPKSVRDALGITAGDRIAFHMDDERRVILTREDDDEDPVIGAFLNFLASDMQSNPDRSISSIPESLQLRIHRLTAHSSPGLEEDIDGPVEL